MHFTRCRGRTRFAHNRKWQLALRLLVAQEPRAARQRKERGRRSSLKVSERVGNRKRRRTIRPASPTDEHRPGAPCGSPGLKGRRGNHEEQRISETDRRATG